MFYYKSLIVIDRNHKRAVYLQISDAIIKLIKKGVLQRKNKLPSTRELANLLGVNRQTIVSVYIELQAQNWVITIPYKGTFVSEELPVVKPNKISNKKYEIEKNKNPVDKKFQLKTSNLPHLIMSDGLPDERLVPLNDLNRSYRTALKKIQKYKSFNSLMGKTYRNEQVIANYLNTTRGLQTKPENILITNGSQIGIYLTANTLLTTSDVVVVGKSNYSGANEVFEKRGLRLIKVNVDDNGLCVDELELICKKIVVKCVYTTPHHHYPTTVTLSADRRMKLMFLAEKYRFYIIEDDYDYDFHYARSPLLPLASTDYSKQVIYIGSMSNIITPTFRFGYIVANKKIIAKIEKLRFTIDRRHDIAFVLSIVDFIKEGELQRHLKKILKIYQQRRDHFCSLLKRRLGKNVRFNIPNGGLAVWVGFDKSINLQALIDKVLIKGLYIPSEQLHCSEELGFNAIRMGFASFNIEEIEEVVGILDTCVSELLS